MAYPRRLTCASGSHAGRSRAVAGSCRSRVVLAAQARTWLRLRKPSLARMRWTWFPAVFDVGTQTGEKSRCWGFHAPVVASAPRPTSSRFLRRRTGVLWGVGTRHFVPGRSWRAPSARKCLRRGCSRALFAGESCPAEYAQSLQEVVAAFLARDAERDHDEYDADAICERGRTTQVGRSGKSLKHGWMGLVPGPTGGLPADPVGGAPRRLPRAWFARARPRAATGRLPPS
jgi:hypothetical protein